MPASGGVETFHIVGWVVAGLGIAANLLWNLSNRRHSNKLAADIRSEQHQRDAWSRIRTKIEDRIDELVDTVAGAPAQIRALPQGTTPKAFLDILNVNIVNSQDALARALKAADDSADCTVMNFSKSQWGKQHGAENSWDILLSKFSVARDVDDTDEQIKQLTALKPYVLEIHDAVAELIRRQDYVLRPAT